MYIAYLIFNEINLTDSPPQAELSLSIEIILQEQQMEIGLQLVLQFIENLNEPRSNPRQTLLVV